MIYAIVLFLAVGATGGFFSGLLGIGGGVIMVPLLSLAFTALGVEPGHIYRLAVGTSLASITFTSLASAKAHNKHLPLHRDLIKGLACWLVLGTLAGSCFATRINPVFLKIFFMIFIFSIGARMFFSLNLRQREKPLPSSVSSVAGIAIGAVCSLVGIGGGTIIVPYVHWNCNTMLCAIGVSAALGVFISISGTLGYMINGIVQNGISPASMPWGAFGYVHLPGLAAIMAAALLTAPLGVKLAHRLTECQLKIVFGIVMLTIGAGMAAGLTRDLLLR